MKTFSVRILKNTEWFIMKVTAFAMYSSLKMDGKCGKVHSDAVQIFQM
jgi:hypothetical protein